MNGANNVLVQRSNSRQLLQDSYISRLKQRNIGIQAHAPIIGNALLHACQQLAERFFFTWSKGAIQQMKQILGIVSLANCLAQ